MSGQCSPVQKHNERIGPRGSALDVRLAIAARPAGLRLRGSLHITGTHHAGVGRWEVSHDR